MKTFEFLFFIFLVSFICFEIGHIPVQHEKPVVKTYNNLDTSQYEYKNICIEGRVYLIVEAHGTYDFGITSKLDTNGRPLKCR